MLCRGCFRQLRKPLQLAPLSQLITRSPRVSSQFGQRAYTTAQTETETGGDDNAGAQAVAFTNQADQSQEASKKAVRKLKRLKQKGPSTEQAKDAPAKTKAPGKFSEKDAKALTEHTMKSIVGNSPPQTVTKGSLKDIKFEAIDVERGVVPGLSYGLDRVLFNPGVYHLQDPRSLVYNFDPYLGSIMPVKEFDFSALNEYITSSKDELLRRYAKEQEKKYIGSSSSMTSVLSQFHFLLSNWRPISTKFLSQGFTDPQRTFTRLSRAPAAIFLRYKDGVYAIDADKEFDTANILMHLGKSMEKLLTVPTEEFEKYRKTNTERIDPDQVDPEVYHYSTCGDFLMRSQLDAHDPRLPGTGMFDLKTRAVVSIRMDAQNHEEGMGYQIKGRFGNYESFEREYFDMIRAAFLKYSLQVRIGRMDGIFVAFHNIKRIFGFQYFSLSEMDQTIHGQANTSLGHREFKLSLGLWNKILDKATERFPKQSLRFHFETRDSKTPFMYIFAEPVTEEEVDAIQSRNHAEIEEISKKLLGDDEKVEAALQAQADAEREEDSTSSKTLPGEGVNAEEAAGAGSKVVDSGSMEPSNVSDFEPSTAEAKAHSEQSPEATPEQASSEESEPEVDTSRPLFAMLLSIQNKVNGKIVERPQTLKPKDKWELNYELRSFTDQERAWQYYNLCKSRRQKELDKKSEEGSSRDDFFTMLLKKLSQSGNSWREKINKIEKDMGIVTLKDRR